jgi:CRP-like cAMP-binding protein
MIVSCHPASVAASAPFPLRVVPSGESEPFPFAGWLDRDDLVALGRHVVWHSARNGETLWREGEADDRLALVVRGRVKLVKETAFPGRPAVLGLFGPGALVADLSFAAGLPREASGVAVGEVEAVFLSRTQFEFLASERPDLARSILTEVLRSVADHLRHLQGRLASIF